MQQVFLIHIDKLLQVLYLGSIFMVKSTVPWQHLYGELLQVLYLGSIFMVKSTVPWQHLYGELLQVLYLGSIFMVNCYKYCTLAASLW